MNEFLTTGFNLHFMKEILDNVKTNHFVVDSLIMMTMVTIMNQKNSFFKMLDIQKWKNYITNYFYNEIEYRLSSVRKSNYEGSFNVCPENICSVCHCLNNLIQTDKTIDTTQIMFFEEFMINEVDGYNDDISLIVPIGNMNIHTKGIRVITYLQSKEQDEKHGKKTHYKQIEISLFSKSHNKIQNFLDQCVKEYRENLDIVSNDEIKWFRLREITRGNGPSYFSRKLEHKATFENLHFDGKGKLLKMLTDLSNGKRDKICLLLHGPPGSGKDSVIVAMAKYLSELNKTKHNSTNYKKRHIVAYPLDLFTTSDDLMRVWHGKDKIDGYNIPNDQQLRVCPEIEKYNPDVVCSEIIREKVKEKEKPEEANEGVFEIIQKHSDMEMTKDNYDLITMLKTMHGNMNKTTPKLKLAPIIECLDSFMNQKGTLVVFTTNLPLECIHEVLIRNERLDKFYLGPSSKENIYKIIQNYFPNIPSDIEIPDGKLMPSDINYYCKLSKTVEECINYLQNHK